MPNYGIDYKEVERLRAEKMKWKDIAKKFGFVSASSARSSYHQWKDRNDSTEATDYERLKSNIGDLTKHPDWWNQPTTTGYIKFLIDIPTYDEFIEWCKDNPEIPFTDQMYHNCEVTSRKHWRSIVRTTIDLLKRYNEGN